MARGLGEACGYITVAIGAGALGLGRVATSSWSPHNRMHNSHLVLHRCSVGVPSQWCVVDLRYSKPIALAVLIQTASRTDSAFPRNRYHKSKVRDYWKMLRLH